MRKSLGRLTSAAALATLALLISPISGNASTMQSEPAQTAADVKVQGFWGTYPDESTLHALQQCHDLGRQHRPSWWSAYYCEEHPNIKTRYWLRVLWN